MRVLALLCLVLVGSAQCISTKPSDNTADFVLKIINTIVEFFDTALTYGEKFVGYIDGGGLDLLQVSIGKIITEIVEYIEGRFQQRVDGATDLDVDGLKLWNCIKNDKDKWNAAIMTYYDDLTKCVNPTIIEMFKLIDPILKDLRTVEKKVAGDAAPLTNCADSNCILGIILQIVDDAMSVPDVVAPEIQAFLDEWPVLQNKAAECSEFSFGDLFEKIFTQLSSAAKCYKS